MSGTFTEQDIRDWMRRHNLGNCMSTTDAGCAMGDAASIHMIDVPSRIADLESQLAAANAMVEEQREAVRVLAGVFSDMNHHASCGNYDNGVENNGADEGDVMHVLFMEDCYRRAISNPIAKAAINAAKSEKGGK